MILNISLALVLVIFAVLLHFAARCKVNSASVVDISDTPLGVLFKSFIAKVGQIHFLH